MPLPSRMWNDISQALGSAANANLSAASAGHDLYEAYVWTLVLAAACEGRRHSSACGAIRQDCNELSLSHRPDLNLLDQS